MQKSFPSSLYLKTSKRYVELKWDSKWRKRKAWTREITGSKKNKRSNPKGGERNPQEFPTQHGNNEGGLETHHSRWEQVRWLQTQLLQGENTQRLIKWGQKINSRYPGSEPGAGSKGSLLTEKKNKLVKIWNLVNSKNMNKLWNLVNSIVQKSTLSL